MLRVTVGITVVVQARFSLASTDIDPLVAVPAAALAVCGVALTLGIFTSVCSTLVALGYVLVLFTPLGGAVLQGVDGDAAVLGLATAAGLGLLGPGALSIDARFFGRREIIIPSRQRRF